MFERFTDRARQIITLAREEARDHHHREIHPEHLLVAMVHEGGGLAAQIINVDLGQTRRELLPDGVTGDGLTLGHVPFSTATRHCVDLSLREALILGHNYIGTEHLLLGVLRHFSRRDTDRPWVPTEPVHEATRAERFLDRHGVTMLAVKQHFAGLSADDYPAASRNVLLREIASLDSRIDRKTDELAALQRARADIAAHLEKFDSDSDAEHSAAH